MTNTEIKAALVAMTGGPVKVRARRSGDMLDIFLPKSVRVDPVRANILMGEVQRMTGRIPFMQAVKVPGVLLPCFHIQPLFEERA